MKYKLKEHVTDEMLAKLNYLFDSADEVWFKDTYVSDDLSDYVDDTVIIDIFNGNKIQCLNCERDYIDCTYLIQDLIELGYVEVEE